MYSAKISLVSLKGGIIFVALSIFSFFFNIAISILNFSLLFAIARAIVVVLSRWQRVKENFMLYHKRLVIW